MRDEAIAAGLALFKEKMLVPLVSNPCVKSEGLSFRLGFE
jgi:hypothetical protein